MTPDELVAALPKYIEAAETLAETFTRLGSGEVARVWHTKAKLLRAVERSVHTLRAQSAAVSAGTN